MKKDIYFISFLLVCYVSGNFLDKQNRLVDTIIYFLSIMVAIYLLHKALPINYRKEGTDNEN